MHASMQNMGALIGARHAAVNITATAGGSGDATETNGAWIDRQGFQSVKVVVVWSTTLAAAATLSIAANLQDASAINGTGAADFGDALAATVVATGPGGGGTVTGVTELDFDVSGADRYIRIQFTPDLSASGTDTARLAAVYIVGGSADQPVTATAV